MYLTFEHSGNSCVISLLPVIPQGKHQVKRLLKAYVLVQLPLGALAACSHKLPAMRCCLRSPLRDISTRHNRWLSELTRINNFSLPRVHQILQPVHRSVYGLNVSIKCHQGSILTLHIQASFRYSWIKISEQLASCYHLALMVLQRSQESRWALLGGFLIGRTKTFRHQVQLSYINQQVSTNIVYNAATVDENCI